MGHSDFAHVVRAECGFGLGRLDEAEGLVLGTISRLLNWLGESQFSCSISHCPPPGSDCTVGEGIGSQKYKSTADISCGTFGVWSHESHLAALDLGYI